VLVYFIVGCLVWLLVHMLRDREEQLRQQLDDLEATRGKLIEEEKLAAIGRLASAVAHEIRNPVAIISSALETAASASFASKEREEMSRIAGMEAKRLEKLTTDFSRTPGQETPPFDRSMQQRWLATSFPLFSRRPSRRIYKLKSRCAIPVAPMAMKASCSRYF